MAKKDFGRRLMPEYLLKYSEELQKNHPDPSASWGGGGGGGDYTAGEGIEISDQDVISIDEEVVAKKTDIPDVSDFVTDTDLNTALADYELKSEAFSGSYNDLTDKPTLATVATTGDYDDLLNKPTIPTVPSVLSAFTNDVGYITGITSADVITALGYTPGTSNFSGDYEDLSGKPTIPDSTSDLVNDSGFINGITSSMIISALGYTPGTSSFSGSYNDLTDKPTIPTKTSDLQNDSGFITGVTWNDVTGKPTFATVATSGSYNDLTDKPTIPSSVTTPFLGVTQTALGNVMFSTNGTNYYSSVSVSDDVRVNLKALNPNFGNGLSASFNSSTFALDVSIDTTVVALKSDIPTVPTKTSDLQNDSGFITSSALSGYATETWVGNQGFITSSALSGYATETWVGQQGFLTSVSWNDVLNKPTFATVATSGSYNDLTDKPSIPSTASSTSTSTSTVTPTTETLVFTLSDNSTVNVTVMTSATVSTTTTTTTTLS